MNNDPKWAVKHPGESRCGICSKIIVKKDEAIWIYRHQLTNQGEMDFALYICAECRAVHVEQRWTELFNIFKENYAKDGQQAAMIELQDVPPFWNPLR